MLGMLVSTQYFGRYWRWDPKEIGGLCVALWLIALVALQRFSHISDRGSMLLCVGGNVVVSMAWFGANIIDNHQTMQVHGTASGWPLAALLGIQLCILILDFACPHKAAGS
jgi:hypothetical protein